MTLHRNAYGAVYAMATALAGAGLDPERIHVERFVSLPYHHPFMLADRINQLDHMTRGRVMFGVGPGSLSSDAYMMGIDPSTQRDRMEQSLAAIMALLKCEEPVTMKTDWFELKEARLHLAPYSYPHFPIACASTIRSKIPELTQFERAKSMMRYFPPNGTAGFAIFSVNAGYRPRKGTLISAGIDNLFDKTYAEFISRGGASIGGFTQTTRVNEPGRTFWLKANIELR